MALRPRSATHGNPDSAGDRKTTTCANRAMETDLRSQGKNLVLAVRFHGGLSLIRWKGGLMEVASRPRGRLTEEHEP